MTNKRGRRPKLVGAVRKVARGVQPPRDVNPEAKEQNRNKPLPTDTQSAKRKTANFTNITLTGSKGETYQVAVPTSYVKQIPKVWEWDAERYRVAELIAQGIPISQIPDDPEVKLKSRMTIYGWLEHPEFKEHIDAMILETGWASRRERINNLVRVNEILLNKVVREIDSVKLTDKSIGALLSAIQAGSKLIAQEKGEFVEESKVTSDTNVTAQVATVSANMDDMLASKSAEERERLEEEFDKVANTLIRSLTGDEE